jgi:hydrogenase nickel incorporation protein HypA/HybF
MHEMSLAESILQIVEEAARSRGFGQVKVISLEIGALSGVESEALSFCLDLVLKHSVADGARLELQCLPGRGHCFACGSTVEIGALYDACPNCGSYEVHATGGTQMRVKELLVE